MSHSSIEAAIERVRAYARSRGWKKSRLAEEAGMANTVLRAFDEPGWNPTAETLRRLEAIIPENFSSDAVVASPSAKTREDAA